MRRPISPERLLRRLVVETIACALLLVLAFALPALIRQILDITGVGLAPLPIVTGCVFATIAAIRFLIAIRNFRRDAELFTERDWD